MSLEEMACTVLLNMKSETKMKVGKSAALEVLLLQKSAVRDIKC